MNRPPQKSLCQTKGAPRQCRGAPFLLFAFAMRFIRGSTKALPYRLIVNTREFVCFREGGPLTHGFFYNSALYPPFTLHSALCTLSALHSLVLPFGVRFGCFFAVFCNTCCKKATVARCAPWLLLFVFFVVLGLSRVDGHQLLNTRNSLFNKLEAGIAKRYHAVFTCESAQNL